MVGQNRRRYTRKQINRESEIQWEGEQAYTGCFIKDISINGMQIFTRRKLERDSTIRFKLKTCLNNSFNSGIIKTWVHWHRTINNVNIYGVSFLTLQEQDKERIADFVYGESRTQTEGQEERLGVADAAPIRSTPLLLNQGVQKGGGAMPGGDFEDKRIFERLPVNLPVRFLDVSSNKEGIGQTEDVSAKGIGFSTDEQLLPMTPLEMWVDFPDKGEALYTRGEVIWSRASGGKYRAGINLERADLMGMSRLLRLA